MKIYTDGYEKSVNGSQQVFFYLIGRIDKKFALKINI